MAQQRRLKIKVTKSEGATVKLKIQGMTARLPESGIVYPLVLENTCYSIVLECYGGEGKSASVELDAVHRDFNAFSCTMSDTISSTKFAKLEVKIPRNEETFVGAAKFAVKKAEAATGAQT